MTYQSFPNRPLIFPDQAAKLNHFGVQPLKANYVIHEQLLPAGHDAHPSWQADAHRMAMARVQNSQASEHKMLQGPPSVKGGRPYLTKRYQFDKPYYTQLQGGVATTREGERMIGDLVRDRIQQHNDIAAASFEAVSPERVASITPQTDSFALDALFSSLLTAVNEGFITKVLVATMGSITNTIATTGDRLSGQKLGQYAQVLAELGTLILDVIERPDYNETSESKRILSTLIHDSQKLWKFIKKMEEYGSAPTKTRAIALAGERAKLLELARQSVTLAVPDRPPADTTTDYVPNAPGWESTVVQPEGSGYRRRR